MTFIGQFKESLDFVLNNFCLCTAAACSLKVKIFIGDLFLDFAVMWWKNV